MGKSITHEIGAQYRKTLYRVLRRNPRVAKLYLALHRAIKRSVLWWHKGLKTYGVWWRIGTLATVAVVIVAAVAPLVSIVLTDRAYALTADSRTLVGTASATLADQLVYNAQAGTYFFNQASTNNNPSSLATQVGVANGKGDNKSLYALEVSQQFKKGVKYTDSNTGLSFNLSPQFSGLDGKVVDNHLVFPLADDTQAIYTLKGNGLKEDIVVQKTTKDPLSFSYTVNLPKTLSIKMIPDGGGAIGVYSADPTLFGNVSYGSVSDQAAVQKARESNDKNYLLFGLPAPVAKDIKGNVVGKSKFVLSGDTLTVQASGLSGINGPITIDPSVVVTSSSDFTTSGNNEGNIDFGTAGQIRRGGLTGGDINSWTATSNFTNGRESAATIAYNGYLYVMGGYQRSPNVKYSDIQYAPINSDGTIGTWQATTSLPAAYSHSMATVYNGYLYLVGGITSSTTSLSYFAKLNSDGTVGPWSTATSLPGALTDEGLVAYQGYMYVLGGTTTQGSTCGANSSCLNTTYYAPINADGTLGSWVAMGNLPISVASMGAIANNGYMYIIGGANTAVLTTVYYAPINADGTLGSWTATTSLTSGRYSMATYFYNGYLYTTAGYLGKTDTLYAPVYANGSVGAWTSSSTTLSAGVTYPSYAVYGGVLYILGGYNSSGTTDFNTTQYAKVQPPGYTTQFATMTNNFSTARALICSVALNGYIYAIGGSTSDGGAGNVTTVQYASLNSATGNNGAWASTTVLPAARGSAGCTVYNGIVYVVAGYTGTSTSTKTIYYATQGSGGTLGSWTTATNALTASDASNKPGVFIYANSSGPVMYVLGGCGSYGNASCSQVYYSSLNASTGAPGTWTQATNSMLNNYAARGYAQIGNYLYAMGGQTGSNTASTVVEYTSIDSSGVPGAWTTTTALPVAISWNLATTVNGCIYTLGGEDGASNSRAQVYYACPTANGTIVGWNSAPNLTIATTDMGVTSYNGYIYGVGGYTTGVQTTTQFARVNNGGSGQNGTWTSTGSSVTSCAGVTGQGSVAVYNGYIYASNTNGGCSLQYAPINADGTVGAWASTSTPAGAGVGISVIALNGYLYSLGGFGGGGNLSSSYYAPINANGTIGTWNTLTSNISTLRDTSAAVAYNGYIYVIGGDPGETVIDYAKPGVNGNITTWSTTSMPGRYGATAVAYNGYLYVLGGSASGGGTPNNTVIYAPINSNGSLGTWLYTAPMLTAQYTSAVAYNGFLYVTGGSTTDPYSSTTLTTSQYAPIYANGMIGAWQAGTVLPATTDTAMQSSFVYKGNIYVHSFDGSGPGNDKFYYAPLSTLSRTAQYSKLMDLGTSANITSIVANGTGVTTAYRSASSGAVFGNQKGSTAATGVGPCVSGTDMATRYVWLTASLDDSGMGVFPDSNSIPANLTDITVNYMPTHPLTTTRLRTGQTLQQGSTLSSLDTCPM